MPTNSYTGPRLILVPFSSNGYSVSYLRDQAGLGQALAYIRPLQEKLYQSPLNQLDVKDVSHTYGFLSNTVVGYCHEPRLASVQYG